MNIETDAVLGEIRRTALKYNINKVVLFGSRARGDNTPKSDYDIAVFANNSELYERTSFLNEIEDIETLNKIDVIFIKKRHIDTELYNNIMREGIEIMNKFQIKLKNYTNALARLHESIEDSRQYDNLTFRDGVIQRFEFTAELAWKTVREYLLSENVSDINTPKAVMREAFSANIINDDRGWIQILNDRNSTPHIYDEEDAAEIYERIISIHIVLFDELLRVLSE